MKDPGQIARTTLQRHLRPYPKDDVRYVFTPEEQIAATRAVTRAAGHGVPPALLWRLGGRDGRGRRLRSGGTRDLATRLFGDWKSATPYTRLVDVYQDRPAIDERFETPDKDSAVFAASVRLPLRDDRPDYPAMLLGNFLTGGGFLNSRLATRIRQKDGLSYSVGSRFSPTAGSDRQLRRLRHLRAAERRARWSRTSGRRCRRCAMPASRRRRWRRRSPAGCSSAGAALGRAGAGPDAGAARGSGADPGLGRRAGADGCRSSRRPSSRRPSRSISIRRRSRSSSRETSRGPGARRPTQGSPAWVRALRPREINPAAVRRRESTSANAERGTGRDPRHRGRRRVAAWIIVGPAAPRLPAP